MPSTRSWVSLYPIQAYGGVRKLSRRRKSTLRRGRATTSSAVRRRPRSVAQRSRPARVSVRPTSAVGRVVRHEPALRRALRATTLSVGSARRQAARPQRGLLPRQLQGALRASERALRRARECQRRRDRREVLSAKGRIGQRGALAYRRKSPSRERC